MRQFLVGHKGPQRYLRRLHHSRLRPTSPSPQNRPRDGSPDSALTGKRTVTDECLNRRMVTVRTGNPLCHRGT
jgi:hypothetical protein